MVKTNKQTNKNKNNTTKKRKRHVTKCLMAMLNQVIIFNAFPVKFCR